MNLDDKPNIENFFKKKKKNQILKIQERMDFLISSLKQRENAFNSIYTLKYKLLRSNQVPKSHPVHV
jgi:hypothetical protein